MDQQSDNAMGTASGTSWVIAGTIVFRPLWSWAAPKTVEALDPEPPADGDQFRLFDGQEACTDLQPVSAAVQDPAPSSAEDDEEPAHEDLADPVVAAFVRFKLPPGPVPEPKGGDVEVDHAFDPIRLYDTLKNVYRALVNGLEKFQAVRVSSNVWRFEIGYRILASESGCSERSIPGAIKELAAHGYVLRHPDRCGGKHTSQYYVRQPEGMKGIFDAAGVNRARKLGDGKILLFRTADKSIKDDAK